MDLQASFEPLIETLNGWVQSGIANLPNFIVAIVVILVFAGIARIAKRIAMRVSQRMDANVAITRLMSTIAQYAIILAGVLVALGVLGLQKTVVSLLAGAGVAGLAIGFAFQDLAANFIAGISMGFRKPFSIGDIIKTGDHFGTVETISLRNTVVKTFSGQRVIMPNRLVFENPLTNYSAHGSRRVEIAVGVAYDTDLELATKTAHDAVEPLDCRVEGTNVDVFAREFGGSSIDFIVRYWIDSAGGADFFKAHHDGVLAIKKAFDEAEISIPFPIRTLDVSGLGEEFRPLVVERDGGSDASEGSEDSGEGKAA